MCESNRARAAALAEKRKAAELLGITCAALLSAAVIDAPHTLQPSKRPAHDAQRRA